MFLTKLALKNLARHRNRTLITATIIAFAIFFYIFLDSMIGGMTEMSYDAIVDYEAGHLQVVQEEYWAEEEELPLDNLLSIQPELIDVVEDLEGYRASSPELNFQAMLNSGSNEIPVIGKGIKPELFMEVFDFREQFVKGSMFSDGEYKAVIGQRLAELLKLETGDYITLLVRDVNKSFNTIDVEVGGFVHTANDRVNAAIVYLPMGLVSRALNTGDRVSKLIIRLDDRNRAPVLAGRLEGILKSFDTSLSAHSWQELEAVSIAGVKQAGNQLIMGIILAIAAIAIINTVILGALERMEEIGMMKAMGMQTKEVIYTFVLESAGIGVLGGLSGVFLGAIGVWLLARFGLDFNLLFGMELSSFGVPVLGKLYGVWNPGSFILVFCFGVLVSLLSSILPAYWAADKDPIKAIYHR
ncbi:MAG TPA: FtsX-like permease family protein [Halanaerobiales bacterium]|nr:FtsX-like permease family protein [Halanaerobiales bacterium]